MRRLLIACFLLSIVGLTGCEPEYRAIDIKVYHLKDGRYCFKDQKTGLWYWLIASSSYGTSTPVYKLSQELTAPGDLTGYRWSPIAVPTNPSPASDKPAYGNIVPDSAEIAALEGSYRPNTTFAVTTDGKVTQSPCQVFTGVLVVDNKGNPVIDSAGNIADPAMLEDDDEE